MKGILKVMRFDYLSAKGVALPALVLCMVIFGTLSMVYSPVIASYLGFLPMLFVVPLQGIAEKNGFNKLYGTLPVRRKNITRARFLYIFIVFFAVELCCSAIAFISFSIKVYRFLPIRNSSTMTLIRESFKDPKLAVGMIWGVFAFACIIFSYMEMMGQIKGRENEFKIILITLGVLSAIVYLIGSLSNHDILPPAKLPDMPSTVQGMICLGAVVNIIVFALCIIFGEITASILSKREL